MNPPFNIECLALYYYKELTLISPDHSFIYLDMFRTKYCYQHISRNMIWNKNKNKDAKVECVSKNIVKKTLKLCNIKFQKTFVFWILLILISKSLYPLSTLLILCLILSFGFPGWIPTYQSSLIDCARKSLKFLGFWLSVWILQSTLWLVEFYTHSRIKTKD